MHKETNMLESSSIASWKLKPEYHKALAVMSQSGKELLNKEQLSILESSPRCRSSLVNNPFYHEFVSDTILLDHVYKESTNKNKRAEPRPPDSSLIESIDKPKDRIMVFRRAVHDLARVLKKDSLDSAALDRREKEESRPLEYPLSPFTKPTGAQIKQYVLFTLKAAGNMGLSIKELSNKTGMAPKLISMWLSNNIHLTPRIERIERGCYTYCDEGDKSEVPEGLTYPLNWN